MVKIEELTLDEIDERNRISKLSELAKGVIQQSIVTNSTIGIILSVEGRKSAPITVYPSHNIICVYDRQFFDSAVVLAKRYEASGEPEFTVKKNYE